MNLIKYMFCWLWSSVIVGASVVNFGEKYLPKWIAATYRYGKLSLKTEGLDRIPKRLFRHFYVFSSIWSLLSTSLLISLYFNFINGVPEYVRSFMLFWCGPIPVPAVSSGAALLAQILMTMQCFKRFYETHFVSVFSKSDMHILWYFIGFMHYFGVMLAIICEAPGILSNSFQGLSYPDLTWKQILAVLVFIWAWKNQFETAVLLGNLRKSEKGKVEDEKYHIPKGKYFELVSSPHMTFEVVMYLSLWVILWNSTVWPQVVFWVVLNQMESALLTHWWYKDNYENYPKERKAIIPFIL